MEAPNKSNSMLWDIQYIKANRKKGTPDYLYMIWRNLDTQEKFMQAVKEPLMDIYFEKPEYRTHRYNKNYARLEEVTRKTVKCNNIVREIANDMGEQGIRYLNNAYQSGNYQSIQNLFLYPYVYGADYDPATWYRVQWLLHMDNDIPKKLHKGFLDIEVDGIEVPGMPSATDCPINAVTLIDDWNKTVYTFILTHRTFIPKNTNGMSQREIDIENKRREMYSHMHAEQDHMIENIDEFNQELHDLFDESYGELDYRQYFYTDESKMLVHLFQLINQLKLDFIGIWNISFDIPYIMDRLEALGLDPAMVMTHPDFPVKRCYFKADTINHDIKNKSDSFILTSYTTFYDQMELYASIRKGASELRSYRLNFIANHEIKDTKLDYSEDGDIKTLPYTNFRKFIIYNIKDVLLQMGIERRTTDFDTLYISSYKNATSYDKVFKQTVKLRNVQYLSFLKQGLVPGENINIYNKESALIESEEDDDDDSEFEGALVADPKYNGYVGIELYGRPTNNVFANAVDFDMSAFYPNSIMAMNIDPSSLIFKMIMTGEQFDNLGGDLKLKGITSEYFNHGDDMGKECMDNFQTGNYMSFGYKWLNLPDVSELYNEVKRRMEK